MEAMSDATMSELAEELNKCDAALTLGVRVRFFRKYRKAIWAEINRREPITPEEAAMSDAELVAALKD